MISQNNEFVFCATNQNGEIQEVMGSSSKTRYFRTNHEYLRRMVEHHNRYYKDDIWKVTKFKLVEVKDDAE